MTSDRDLGKGEAARVRRSDTSPRRQARQYQPGRTLHLENAIMNVLAGAGLLPHTYLLTTRGRKSGRARTNPVVPVSYDGRRWLVAPYGEVSWVRNARATRRVRLHRWGRRRDYTVREASAYEAGPVLKQYVRIASATRPYFEATTKSPEHEFTAEADRHPVFELTPAGPTDASEL